MAFRASSVNEEERAFLQRRVALFWKVMFLLSLATTLLEMVSLPKQIQEAGDFIDYGAMLTFGALWLICRRGRPSVGFVRAVEAVGLGAAALLISLMGRYLVSDLVVYLTSGHESAPALAQTTVDYYTSMMVLFGGALLFVMRAAFVPSPAWRTFILTALLGLPYIVIPHFFGPASTGSLPSLRTPSSALSVVTIAHLQYWIMVAVAAAAISHVIFGLRLEVRRARQLGQYFLEGKLGEGGMGVVYRARHGMMRRPTAVKLLRPELTEETSLKRFEREVQLTARLTHPHTITIFDYGRTPDGVFYYAMELLEGASLERVVSISGALPASRVVHVLYHVAAALTEAHDAGLVHRDIKPANIILCRQGGMYDFPKVVDFGLVKDLENGAGANLTQADAVAGTPLYLAPEAINAPEKVGARSDLYSLAAVGYFALTGTPLFVGRTLAEVCGHHVHTPPEPPSTRLGRPLPEDLESVILLCLAKDPEQRPDGARDLLRRLEACSSFGAWTEEDARRWWQENGARAIAVPAASDTELTLTRLDDDPRRVDEG